MNEMQAALFFALLSIPFTCAIGVKLTRGIFRLILVLAAVPVLLLRALRATNDGLLRFVRALELAIVHAPRDAYNFIDRCLQRWFPPRLEFQVEYSTLEYFNRMRGRATTLEAHLRLIGGAW